MSTNYSNGIDSFTPKVDGVDTVNASHVNNLQDSVLALENELGTNPKGSYASVGAAIAAMLPASGGNVTGDVTANSGVKFDGVDIGNHFHSGMPGDAPQIPWSCIMGKSLLQNTVLFGDSDSSGFPTFLTIGTGLSVDVNASTKGLQMDIGGNIIFTNTDASISSLTASSTQYLFAEAGMSLTFGSTDLAPIYSALPPATPATGQHWFNIPFSEMLRWNGTMWEKYNRIFIGEATTGTSSVTSVRNYAMRGVYDSGWFAVSADTQYTKDHNLGLLPVDLQLYGATAISPPADVHQVAFFNDGTDGYGGQVGAITEVDLKINAASGFDYPLSYLGSSATSGFYRVIARRGW